MVTAVQDDQILDAPGDVELTVEVDTEVTCPHPSAGNWRAVSMAAYGKNQAGWSSR
jgi:hypothetical protein